MAWFGNLPIRRKLTLVILAACSAVLLLACTVLAGYELFEYRRATRLDMTALADVLAQNTRAALAFQDDSAARDTLQALGSEPYVAAAGLYGPDGALFAAYTRAAGTRLPARPAADGYRFERGRLSLFRPVLLNGRRIGTIYLEAGLEGVYGRVRLFGAIAGLVLLGALVVALVLSPPLQRPISRPILELAETARKVAEDRDFAVRAVPRAGGEIGVLTRTFNRMLDAIEEREKALGVTNEVLRREVVERQAAEQGIRAQLGRLELLQRITRAIGERQDLRSIFHVVTRALEEHLPVDFCCVCLREPGSPILAVASVGERSEALAKELALGDKATLEAGPSGLAGCLDGRLLHEPDLGEARPAFPRRLAAAGLGALVAAPLLVESSVFGVLLAARRPARSFSSAECEFLRGLSEHVALAVHQAQLNGALQQAYDDLRQTQQAVMQQERLRALGQMASGIAHDINNAISPIAIYAETMLEYEAGLSERARNYLGTIQRAVQDVAQTVSRLREFYRHREPELATSPMALNDLVPQVLELSRARWSDMPQQRGLVIRLATELAPDLPPVTGVEAEIREALLNLVFNAVDAMPEGGSLTLRTRAAGSPEGPSGAPSHVCLEVSDTGIGMSEETRRRCLEPFFTTKGERGTGLGLAMVYGTVKRHQGEIEIESAPGRGTTFRLIFPAAQAKQPAAGRPAEAPAVPRRQRILVVDDDPLLINSLRDILENDGHQVVAAAGGQAGIDAFRQAQAGGAPFAVVITDLGMPYVDGRAVAAAIKAASPRTPVILLTGWGQRLVEEGDIPPHVDRVVPKPPSLRALREAIAQVLSPPPAGHPA